jgi:hypothetical protein
MMSKFLSVFAILVFGSLAFAESQRFPNSWITGQLLRQSLANKAQVLVLQRLVQDELRSKRSNEESIKIINEKLRQLELPEIASFDPEIQTVAGHGFVGGLEGAEINDGVHRYCLPCSADGWNQFYLGIVQVSK